MGRRCVFSAGSTIRRILSSWTQDRAPADAKLSRTGTRSNANHSILCDVIDRGLVSRLLRSKKRKTRDRKDEKREPERKCHRKLPWTGFRFDLASILGGADSEGEDDWPIHPRFSLGYIRVGFFRFLPGTKMIRRNAWGGGWDSPGLGSFDRRQVGGRVGTGAPFFSDDVRKFLRQGRGAGILAGSWLEQKNIGQRATLPPTKHGEGRSRR